MTAVKKQSAEQITVIRKVVIKSVVTEELKKQLTFQADSAIENSRKAIESLMEQKQQLMKKNPGKDSLFTTTLNSLDSEIFRMKRQEMDLRARKEEYSSLKTGALFVQGVIDSPCEIRVGDVFFEKLSTAEIILDDGKVTEIRNI